MKRIALIFISVILLFSSCCLGEDIYGSIGSPEETILSFQVKKNETAYLVHTNLLPAWVFRMEIPDFGAADFSLNTEALEKAMNSSFQRWTALMNFQEVKGLFSADLVECSNRKKSADLSWGDLMMLFELMEYADQTDAGIKAISALLKNQLIDTAEKYPDLRFQADLFETEKAFSVSLVRGEDPVGTFSARMVSDKELHIVAGSAENGKTYYREIKAEFPNAQELSLTLRALTDDQGAGYRAVKENSSLTEEEILIRGLGTELASMRSSWSIGPNQSLSGSLAAEYNTSIEGEFSFSLSLFTDKNQDTENLRILVDNKAGHSSEWPAEPKYYDLMNPDAALTEELQKDVLENMGTLMQLLKLLPSEFMVLTNQ